MGATRTRGDPPGGMAGEVQPCLPIVRVTMGLESPCKGAWAPQGDSPGGRGLWGVVPGAERPMHNKTNRGRKKRAMERGEKQPLEARSVSQRQRGRGSTFWGTQTSWATSLAAVQRLFRHKGVGAHTSLGPPEMVVCLKCPTPRHEVKLNQKA